MANGDASRDLRDEVSSGDEEDCNGDYVTFYRDRPEWQDVTPIPQDEGPNPVVRIAYSDEFNDVYSYFRAVLKSGEKSERVLKLTGDALNLNPANYTVWYYRREVLKEIDCDLKQEMKYCREMIEEHPKNYQVWQHRRALIEWTQDSSGELRFTQMILSQDQKNYHAWQHRQWVLLAFDLWQHELEFVDDLIAVDIRNNSAWNQRFYVISHTSGWTPQVSQSEVNFTMDKINKVPKNESSWNYLRGVLNRCEDEAKKTELKAFVRSWCEEKYSAGEISSYMLGYLVDIIQQDLETKTGEDRDNQLMKLENICTQLATSCDKIRANYWNFILESAKKNLST